MGSQAAVIDEFRGPACLTGWFLLLVSAPPLPSVLRHDCTNGNSLLSEPGQHASAMRAPDFMTLIIGCISTTPRDSRRARQARLEPWRLPPPQRRGTGSEAFEAAPGFNLRCPSLELTVQAVTAVMFPSAASTAEESLNCVRSQQTTRQVSPESRPYRQRRIFLSA